MSRIGGIGGMKVYPPGNLIGFGSVNVCVRIG